MNKETLEPEGAAKEPLKAELSGGPSVAEKATASAPQTEPKTTPKTEPKTTPKGGKNSAEAGAETVLKSGYKKFPTWVDLFAVVGIFVLSSLVGSLVAVVAMRLRGAEELTPDLTLIYYIIQMLPAILYVIWLRRKAGLSVGLHFGVRRIHLPMLLWGVVVLLASSVVLEPLLLLFPAEEYQGVTDMVGLGGWAVLSVVVCAPLLEEILFRGLVFESCRERFGSGAAVLISALMFGIIHGVAVQIINAFVVGLIFGYIYLRTHSLLSVIILHAINNGIAYISLAFFGDAAQTTLHELVAADWLYWAIYAISSLVLVYALARLVLTLRNETELD